jgi:hypothetical protein
LAGITVASFLLATAASAAISAISPEKGTVEPGESTTATFTVVNSLTSCFTSSASPGFTVTFDGLGLGLLPLNCALGGADVTMTVTASANASPGDYRVTLSETAVGGRLIDTHEWPFTVPAPATTTTTIAETTTTTPQTTTTTTSSVTTTSTQSATTTSAGPATNTTDGPDTTNATSPVATESRGSGQETAPATATTVPIAPDTREEDNDSAGEAIGPETSSETNDDDAEVLAAGTTDDLPYNRYPANPTEGGPGFLARTMLSDQLRSQFSRAVPMTVADVVLSPVVIAEFLVRSLLRSAMSLLVPILVATLVGLWMVWRMREEIDDDELALSRQSVV